jgi:polyisoprenoid-binding protein YceI
MSFVRPSVRPGHRAACAAALLATLVPLATPGSARSDPAQYYVDGYHSQAIVFVDHYGIARIGGMFGKLDGTIDVDPEGWTNWSIDVRIPVFEFMATHEPREDAVKGPLLLDAANHPEIKFACKQVEKKGDELVANGSLTIRGTTKDVSFPIVARGPAVDPFGATRIGVEAEMTVKRSDFGIPFDRKLPNGQPVLSDDVTIMLQIEATKEGGMLKKPE